MAQGLYDMAVEINDSVLFDNSDGKATLHLLVVGIISYFNTLQNINFYCRVLLNLEFLFPQLPLLVPVHSKVDLFPLPLVLPHPSPLSVPTLAHILFQHLEISKLAVLSHQVLMQLQPKMLRTWVLLSLHMNQLFSICSIFQ